MKILLQCRKCGKELDHYVFVGIDGVVLAINPCSCAMRGNKTLSECEALNLLKDLNKVTFCFNKVNGEYRTIDGEYRGYNSETGQIYVLDKDEDQIKSIRQGHLLEIIVAGETYRIN